MLHSTRQSRMVSRLFRDTLTKVGAQGLLSTYGPYDMASPTYAALKSS
jgi:hypothetical protein